MKNQTLFWSVVFLFLTADCTTAPKRPNQMGSEHQKVDFKKTTYAPPSTELIGFSTPDSPDVPMTSNDVTEAIEARKNEMAECHVRSPKKDLQLSKGQITFDFKFALKGGPATVKIHQTTVQNKKLEECSLTFMKSLKFRTYQPENGQQISILYPFRFESHQ